MTSKGLLSLGALFAAIVLFVAVNIVTGQAMRSARIDLTQGRLYTLSQGSKNIAAKLQEPVKLTLYYSQKQANDLPQISSFAQRVREMLGEYVNASGGKLSLSVVDPEPFSEAEDRAVQAGLAGVPVSQSNRIYIYFGLVGTNSIDQTETIKFFDPSKEEFLEYDLARLIYLLSNPTKQTVGIMTWLPLEGMEGNPMMGGRGVPPWQIHRKLKESFDLKTISNTVTEIPADIKILLVIHPKGISDQTQYAIDQFVLRGGRVVAFVDPNCEADVPPGMNPFQAMQLPKGSDLPKLLPAWGVQFDPTKVVLDKASAVKVGVGSQGRPENVDYVAWLMLDAKRLNAADPVSGQLERLFVGTAGALTKKDGATTDVQLLFSTSAQAMVAEQSLVSFVPDPKKLLADYVPGSVSLPLAVRVTGKIKSAFPDGAPKPAAAEGEAPPTPVTQTHIAESAEPTSIVVVADCDMLADRFWVKEALFGNLVLGYDEFTDNGTFLSGVIDNLSGSNDLVALRARGKFARPFTRVKELQEDAQQKYQAKEQELQQKLRETEQKINQLQSQRPDGTDSRLLLTPEQQKEIDNFRAQMIDTRKQLRDVQFELNKNTERLGTVIKAVNIGLMPLLIGVFAVGFAAYRASRRSADRQAASKD